MLQLLLVASAVHIVNAGYDQTEHGHRYQKGAVFQGQLNGVQAKCADVERAQQVVVKVTSGYLNPNQG